MTSAVTYTVVVLIGFCIVFFTTYGFLNTAEVPITVVSLKTDFLTDSSAAINLTNVTFSYRIMHI